MELITERLILRRPKPMDGKDYCAIHNTAFVLRYNAMLPTSPERMEKKFSQDTGNTVLLEEKESGTLLGAIFIEEDDLRFGVSSRSLSYFLREQDTRKGYMKEALQAVIRWLFEKENLACVSARVFAPNTASRALLRSLGFQENGVIPRCVKGYGDVVYDDVIHTLFREDFCKE